jgi:acyl dehydratase
MAQDALEAIVEMESEFNWDKLSDAEWNKKLDDRIAMFNDGRGELKVPPAPPTIMDDEYERGINNKLVTEDLIRHYADAVGDPNPIWRDPSYAATTRWGGIIAPPTYESCISYGSAFGGRLRIPGVARMAAGNKHEYFKPIRPGDVFTVYDKYAGIEEKQVEGKAYRLFVESVPRFNVNQRDEIAAIATVRNVYTATPPSKRQGKKANPYAGKVRRHYSKEELDLIHQGYEEQLAGVGRRGAKTRYWEDVVEGEDIRPVVKGPYDVSDACARAIVSTYPYAFAIKWAMMRKHLQHHPIDPETGEYRVRRDWHYEDLCARLMGFPMANSAGIHNEMMLVHLITDWMGDDGWVKSMDSQDRRMHFFGDMTWVKGKVTRKFIENGEHLVELDVWGENQEGVVDTKSTVIIKLVSKAEYKNSL